MRFLAAWFSDPIEYWPNILGLIVVTAIVVFIIRKVQAQRQIQK